MIRFMEEQQVFWLDTPNTSYVIGISDGKYVGHIYYGRRIEGGNLRYLLREEAVSYTHLTLPTNREV